MTFWNGFLSTVFLLLLKKAVFSLLFEKAFDTQKLRYFCLVCFKLLSALN